jgi:uncharacterized protein YbjT (DUF2867 family)
MNIGVIKEHGVHGMPAPGAAPITFIHAPDIGRHAARRMLALDFTGAAVVNLWGPRAVTLTETTAILGRAIGRPDLPYVQFPYADAEKAMVAQGVKPQLAALYIELYKGAAAGLLMPEPGTPVVNTETSLETFASTVFAAAFGA